MQRISRRASMWPEGSYPPSANPPSATGGMVVAAAPPAPPPSPATERPQAPPRPPPPARQPHMPWHFCIAIAPSRNPESGDTPTTQLSAGFVQWKPTQLSAGFVQ